MLRWMGEKMLRVSPPKRTTGNYIVFPGKGIPTGYTIQVVRLKNIHTRNTVETEQILFVYLRIHTRANIHKHTHH